MTGDNTKLKCKLDEDHEGACSEDKNESSEDYSVIWTKESEFEKVKGHELELTADETEYIEWTCVLCSKAIRFSKYGYGEPYTEGTLPAEAGDYMDKCEYEG